MIRPLSATFELQKLTPWSSAADRRRFVEAFK